MNTYTIIKTGVLALSIAIMFSCNTKDEYDWKKVIPSDQKITVIDEDSAKLIVDTINGNNYSVKSYRAVTRGGSKYNWVSLGYPLSISQPADTPFIVHIKADSRKDTFTWLKVTETINGGASGKPDSTKIIIIGFCSFNISELIGNGAYTSKMDYYAARPTKLSIIAGDTVVCENFFEMRWPVKFVLSKDYDQKVTIVQNQVFEYNEEKVDVVGNGTYNTCKGLIVIHFAVRRVFGKDTIQFGTGIDSLIRK
jgi:hypothetical protein